MYNEHSVLQQRGKHSQTHLRGIFLNGCRDLELCSLVGVSQIEWNTAACINITLPNNTNSCQTSEIQCNVTAWPCYFIGWLVRTCIYHKYMNCILQVFSSVDFNKYQKTMHIEEGEIFWNCKGKNSNIVKICSLNQIKIQNGKINRTVFYGSIIWPDGLLHQSAHFLLNIYM